MSSLELNVLYIFDNNITEEGLLLQIFRGGGGRVLPPRGPPGNLF